MYVLNLGDRLKCRDIDIDIHRDLWAQPEITRDIKSDLKRQKGKLIAHRTRDSINNSKADGKYRKNGCIFHEEIMR